MIDIIKKTKAKCISIVGAGGKTSLMFYLGNVLKKNNKVLITTTTHIKMPKDNEYDEFILDIDNIDINLKNGLYIHATKTKDDKLSSLDIKKINYLKNYFDYILIEADGSKRKPLKAWRDNEPVIVKESDLTIGVIDITVLNKEISLENIHRLDLFLKLTNTNEGQKITTKELIKIIEDKNSLFKNSKDKKILFINKFENEENKKEIKKIYEKLEKRYIDYYFCGSIRNKYFINMEELIDQDKCNNNG